MRHNSPLQDLAMAPAASPHVPKPPVLVSSHPRGNDGAYPTLQENDNHRNDGDAEEAGEGDELKTHSDLWFKDGSVVLRAENTLFRVHISQLSRHSAFFRDMFSLPQPQPPTTKGKGSSSSSSVTTGRNGKESWWEGCPFVYLHDKAEDVGNLLTALYDGPYVVSRFASVLVNPYKTLNSITLTLQKFR